jgi:spoIIIJ-associated protein
MTEPTPAVPDLPKILETLLGYLGLAVEVRSRTESQTLFLEVVGDEAEAARGKRGEILDALQYILGKVLGNAGMTEQRVLIDIGAFRADREKSLAEIGRYLSKKALELNKPIAIHPMGAHDRRAVHLAIAEDTRTHSQSEGEGLARRLIIVPGPAPKVTRPPERPRREGDRGERGERREGGDRDRGRGDRRGPPRDGDRPPRPPRPEGEEPRLGTPERPYVMEPPPEPPDDM